MIYTFTSFLRNNYEYGVDFDFTETPYTYESLRWLKGTKPTLEEINSSIEALNTQEPYRQLRILRDKKLRECDWVTLKAYSQGTPVPLEWAEYQQALRDITLQSPQLDSNGDLIIDSIVWPIRPND